MPGRVRQRRSDETPSDEPSPVVTNNLLTNRLSRTTEGDPASGPRLREVVGPPGDPYLTGPYSDEPEMEDDYHVEQNVTIHDTLAGEWEGREDIFIGFNMSVYYAGDFTTPRSQLRKVVFRGPDIFICLGARPLRFRRSWVVANEGGKYPDVIFETLSRSTKKSDRGEKKGIYEKIFKTFEYFMIDPEHHLLEAFRLVNGVYVPIAPDAEGRCWSERMGLFVKLVKDRSGLASFARFFRPEGTMVPTGHEKAAQQSAKAEQERQARENAEAKALRAEDERRRVQGELQRAEDERQRVQGELQLAEDERQRVQGELQRAEDERQRVQGELQRAEDERQRVQGELQRAEDERQRVQGELQRAEDERIREREARERLEEQLRKLGIDPSSLK